MLKNSTYKEKFSILKSWMPAIIESVKKDLKNEHLKKDWNFVKMYFPGKNINKLTTEELVEAYSRALDTHDRAEELGEFVSNRWLLKNSDLYYFFEKEITKIHPDFSDLEELDKDKSLELMEGAIREFGAPQAYLFCVLNSVVFPQDVYREFSQKAEQGMEQAQAETAIALDRQSIDTLEKSYEMQLARLVDKYEKKLGGMQKKYTQDVEGLKKQVAQLQRKLSAQ